MIAFLIAVTAWIVFVMTDRYLTHLEDRERMRRRVQRRVQRRKQRRQMEWWQPCSCRRN